MVSAGLIAGRSALPRQNAAEGKSGGTGARQNMCGACVRELREFPYWNADRPEMAGAGTASRGASMAAEAGPTRITEVQGIVKWFDPKKGFGFIIGPDEQDVFVHYSKILGDGFRVLKDGSTVAYDAELTDRGWHATRVVRGDMLEVTVAPRATSHARSPRR